MALATLMLLLGSGVLAAITMRQPEQAASPKRTSVAATTPGSGGAAAVPWSGTPTTATTHSSATGVDQYALDKEFTAARSQSTKELAPKLPFPGGARAQDVDMSIELRVRDAGELSDSTTEAMRATRSLGGVVRASAVDTKGEEGTARLQLQIPVGRLEDAVLRFSALGKITAQDVATRDLQRGIDRRARQVLALRRAIERDKLILASGTLSPDEKLEVELRLAGERAQLNDRRRERTRLLREAALAELSLTLHTRAAPKSGTDKGGVAGAASDALDFLGGAGATAVFVLVILSPLLALGAILWALLRTRRRRLDDRLLEQPRPHAPPS